MRWARAAHRARGPCWLSARAPVDGPQFLASPPPAPAIRAAVRAPDTTLKWENVSEEEAVATAGAAGDGQAGARSAPRLRARPSPERQRQASSRVPSSVVLIQAGTGGFLQSQRFQEMEASTFEMQGSEQRARARLRHFVEAARGHLAALRIQRAYRRHLAARAAPGRLQAAVRIQRWFRTRLQLKRLQRSHSAGNVNREEDEELRRRSWAASVIQRAARAFLSRRKQQRLQNSVIKIQALWRGHSCRKRSDCAALAAVRRNLQAIGGQAREGDKLYRRAALALHHLLTHRHLSAILEALRHLEAVTRLSPLCCERMAQSAALSKVVTLVRSCNRSVPCMDVISLALQVLLNVAKYEKTAAAVYGVERCVETLLELLQVYRGRPGDRVAGKSRAIFTRACCLLAVLLKAPSRASDVRSRPRMVDCVRGIYKLTARKHGVSPERTLCKQSKSASVSPPALPGTPAAVSRLQPGWVLRRGSLEEITEPLQAIQMVLDTLGVPCP